jgi:hypothetical protein
MILKSCWFQAIAEKKEKGHQSRSSKSGQRQFILQIISAKNQSS